MKQVRIWLPKKLSDDVLAQAYRLAPRETGGVLIGYIGNNSDYVVTHIVGPGKKYYNSKVRFVPDHEYQQSQINIIFQDTGGRSDYIGDWHTHPNGLCQMSWMDRRTLQRIATTKDVNVESPVMMIACYKANAWKISAWKHERTRLILGAVPNKLVMNIF